MSDSAATALSGLDLPERDGPRDIRVLFQGYG